jgi:hypothetical protein
MLCKVEGIVHAAQTQVSAVGQYRIPESRRGQTLRWGTSDTPHEELPDDIKRLLRRLERVEIRDARRKAGE